MGGNSKTIVFSSSITKDIDQKKFNDRYTGGTARFQKFHGGRAKHMSSYLPTHLVDECPDTTVVQVGGNDLPNKSLSINEIADQVIKCGLICQEFGVKNVLIGGITTRRPSYQQNRCKDLNYRLRGLCSANNFTFIDNQKIKVEHLYDGVHLNETGQSILANNYLDALWGVHTQ